MTSKQPLTYFIADLHLVESRTDITDCFLAFLQTEATKAQTLYILGDLFEYWIGDDNDTAFNRKIATALKTLSDTGTAIYFIQGNRDFAIGKDYCKQAGMTLLDDVELIDLYGQQAVILHGDTLCTRDVEYQKFRKKSRTWWWQGIMRALPLFVRRNMAENYRKKSAAATAMKAQEIMDVTPSEVIETLEAYHCQLMIHGHTHRPYRHKIEANGQPAERIVLGDWYDQGAWLKVTPDSMELLNQPFKG
ncbi:UDP-2,3-diacylglucosamine diphosphatase [Thalassotalea agarivorans]|uniref:UDP-2,3-diacylglucosamine hydrolase n=1 Tax=Thalassotalea agarivorans TaxID=349064 RepID=A0A1H9ZNT8_THASX|nr:UDP-2,3-diacylglucosamine diphosphatase [Thalassotalea agarivorans]SES83349.1 UDP-2,3-diacylglucosamine hydrolase [Thalassotalea agarivorans]